MSDYFLDITQTNRTFNGADLNFKEFENCTFLNCNFSDCIFKDTTFIECTFTACVFDAAKIGHSALRTVTFSNCSIREVNFAMVSQFIFEVHFENCVLDFSKFYALKMKGTSFRNSSLIAVDFMSADLTEVTFENCDLYKSEFDLANASRANFKTSYNYTINPKKTKIKKAVFSHEGIKGLLAQHDILVC